MHSFPVQKMSSETPLNSSDIEQEECGQDLVKRLTAENQELLRRYQELVLKDEELSRNYQELSCKYQELSRENRELSRLCHELILKNEEKSRKNLEQEQRILQLEERLCALEQALQKVCAEKEEYRERAERDSTTSNIASSHDGLKASSINAKKKQRDKDLGLRKELNPGKRPRGH